MEAWADGDGARAVGTGEAFGLEGLGLGRGLGLWLGEEEVGAGNGKRGLMGLPKGLPRGKGENSVSVRRKRDGHGARY